MTQDLELIPVLKSDYCSLVTYDHKTFYILVYKEVPSSEELKPYKNIEVFKYWDDSTLLDFGENDYMEDLYEIINKKLTEGYSLIRIIDEVSELFLKSKSKLEKFRGDYAEAAYLAYEGGKPTVDGESFDIIHNDDYIEIKSYSTQQKTIIISIEQLRENTIKKAYPLIKDPDGHSIEDLINLIKDDHPRFANILKIRYENDNDLSTRKFEKRKFHDITDQLSFTEKIPDNIMSGKIKVFINVDDN